MKEQLQVVFFFSHLRREASITVFLLKQGCPVSRMSFATPYFLCSLTMKSHLFHSCPTPYKSVPLSRSSLTRLDVIFLSCLQLPGFYLRFSLPVPALAVQARAGHLKAQTLHGNKVHYKFLKGCVCVVSSYTLRSVPFARMPTQTLKCVPRLSSCLSYISSVRQSSLRFTLSSSH